MGLKVLEELRCEAVTFFIPPAIITTVFLEKKSLVLFYFRLDISEVIIFITILFESTIGTTL